MYLGQAIGAASGGLGIAAGGYDALPGAALAWMAAALALSLGLAWHMRGGRGV
jgi:predicted MFS family arabinose efflux permease